MARGDKGYRADAAQFFVAGELCRRELVAVVTMGNCPNTDVLVSDAAGTRFAHVQVKTFVPGNRTCSVGMKAEREYGRAFFWVLAGIPTPTSGGAFEYYIVPSADMAHAVRDNFQRWASALGTKGQAHDRTTTVRTVQLPPRVEKSGWSLDPFRDRWGLIIDAIAT